MKRHFALLRAGLFDLRDFARYYADTLPNSLALAAGRVVLLFSLLALTLFTISCASTLAGLSREQAWYQAGTNIVAQTHALTPYLPPPVGNTVEIVLALASSALATWNLHQQGQIKQLRNGHGTPGANGKLALAAPLLAQPSGTIPPTL